MDALVKVCMERSALGCDIITILKFFEGSSNSYHERVVLSTEEDEAEDCMFFKRQAT